MSKVTLLQGDCLQKLKELKDNSIDSVVTDPPYHLTSIVKRFGKDGSAEAQYGTDGAFQRASKGFMGKEWDGLGEDGIGIANNPELWKEVLRVLKPGGHLLSFSHSRTYHRQAVAVEDSGFEIRDQIMWIYGSGFPKSHNIGKAVDKIQGNEREVVGSKGSYRDMRGGALDPNLTQDRDRLEIMETKGNSPYEGWGTALKPAHEPIVMARKPFKGTVAQNVLEHGTGGINIDGCRVGTEKVSTHSNGVGNTGDKGIYGTYGNQQGSEEREGRFPANIIFDEEAGKILDEQSGITSGTAKKQKFKNLGNGEYGKKDGRKTMPTANEIEGTWYGDTGGASRFFYCPKASKKDRNEGCDELEEKLTGHKANHRCKNCGKQKSSGSPCVCKEPDYEEIPQKPQSNFHPTVKPTDLMAYLVRLVTPKGGTVLDPFMGSGSTGKAAVREGFDFVGIEREDEYMEIAKSRIEHEQSKHKHRKFFDEV